jgi:DAK2 domain fusion protein YloV
MPEPRPQPAPSGPAASPGIDGPALARAFRGGWAALRDQAAALNAINVFPVPDGDTGTNMSSTMRAAIEEVDRAAGDALSQVAAAAAHGTLMGAKGNSGVILSQIVGAFSKDPATTIDASALARILDRGRAAAYRVVTNPREGTILTAITAAAEAASRTTSGATAEDALAAATAAAHEAARRSPELMPLLKEAGVVDAGAQGLYVMFDGMLRALRGETAPSPADELGAIDAAWLAAAAGAHNEGARAEGTASGYCTEFVIHAPSLDPAVVRDLMRPLGGSLLVVGGQGVTRVHLHTAEPEAAFAAARALGTLSHEKADDMEAQFRRLAATPAAAPPRAGPAGTAVAVVAVGAGAGIEALLRSIGATSVVLGGQTMNPSAGEIRAAIEGTGATDVIVLPDNKNVIMAARQAAEGLAARVHVVPARSIPQGVAALVALNTEATFDDNVAAMERAIAAVRTGEVTLAARATHVHGIAVAQGQPIGLVDGDLVVAEASIPDAVRACVRRMVEDRPGSAGGGLVTLYAGEGVTLDETERLATALREELHVDVEVIDGGQPHYPYLIGVE